MPPSKPAPLVSVLIPCHNYGKYIAVAVDSILRQTHRHVEIIIVDDGSTDAYTLDKLKHYNKPKTTVVFREKSFPSAARNAGFSRAAGRYILTLDADDLFEETFVEKAIRVLDDDPAVGAVSSYVLKFGHQDAAWRPLGGGIENFILGINCVACALIRREAWTRAGGFDASMTEGYEDWDFWIRVTKCGYTVHIIPEFLFFYRTKPASRVDEAVQKHYTIFEQIRNNHPEVFARYMRT